MNDDEIEIIKYLNADVKTEENIPLGYLEAEAEKLLKALKAYEANPNKETRAPVLVFLNHVRTTGNCVLPPVEELP
jgi:hypothetical protein